jgi:hypothetical protein
VEQKEYKDGWKITLHQKKHENKADMLRVDCSFKNVKREDLVEYMTNPPPHDDILERKCLEKIDENTSVNYWKFKMPMMSDRDNVIQIHKSDLAGGNKFFVMKSVEREDCPEVAGAVRMFMFSRGLISINNESPSDTIDYTEITYMNLNGHFPTGLMNMIMASSMTADYGEMYKALLKISAEKK